MVDPKTSPKPEFSNEASESGDAAESLRPTVRQARNGASMVPDWAPWTVLGSLVSFGLLGGMGVVPLPSFGPSAVAAAATTTAPSTSSKAPGVKLRPTPASSADPEEKISVHYLVVSHAGTQLGKHHGITRSAEDARKRAGEAQARAAKGEDFAVLVSEYTDEPKASGKNGRLGPFRRKHADKRFADVAFALKVGEISEVTETAFGFNVIKRLE
jgi:NIMA-interacting peptidyl-prolyl cis-trans isomerase 1